MLNINSIRDDFPILHNSVYDHPLVYLDNGATTQIPKAVLECLEYHYCRQNANVHRGIHYLSEQSTIAMEKARKTVSEFLHSSNEYEIVFTSGTTDALNIVAFGYAEPRLKNGKRVITTEIEHHSNFVPWQMASKRSGGSFSVIPYENNALDLEYLKLVLEKEDTILLTVTALSNVLGLKTPLKKIIDIAHGYGVPVCVDAAQAMRHGEINVQELDCEFLVFSAHKMMGPAGVGVLYGKSEYLEKIEPIRYGGGMVDKVGLEKTSIGQIPVCLEAGTPNYPGIIAFEAAIHYLSEIGITQIASREAALTSYLERQLRDLSEVHIMGGSEAKYGVVSMVADGVHPYDLASVLDKYGIAGRSGSHCAQPLVRKLGYESIMRFSPAFYNTTEEIDFLKDSMKKALEMLRKWK